MILRALALFALLQVALTRRDNACGEGEFYNRLILACDQCTSGCPQNSYIERPCTPYEDTQCIECGVVDHENEDFNLKCGVQVDQDFKDAIEVQIRGQLEKTFALREVKLPRKEETEDDQSSEVDQMLKKINDEWPKPDILSISDDDDDETEDSENEADVAFVFTNLKIADDSDEPKPKIGQGAVPAWDTDSAETDVFRSLRYAYKQNERNFLKKGSQRRVETKEIEDESDYEEEEPLKIVKELEEDELQLIELEENDRRLVSFEEVDEEKDPFPELLPQKIKKRPMPAVRLLDPLFDLDEEEENLKKVDDDSDSDSDDSDENTPVIKEMIIERIKPQVIDFQTWKQQIRENMKNKKWDDDDDDSDSDSDESLEEEMTAVKSANVPLRKHVFRAMALTSFFILVLVLLFWIAQLRRRNRIYRYHISKLRYLTPEERQVIERAVGFLQKSPMNIYENQVYESA
ncbi:unnamed protein product, partial [Mesorhabditis belari]|uniref:TNFR-Cys domain-containing protein n=1 Tax=Mesorhabditis belari TaxID=2138241 RepID=A0AAF3F7E7_9BILA